MPQALAPSTLQRPPRAVAHALSYVDAHLNEPLTALALAEHAACSPHHFHRLFAAHLGCSVATYITWRRLQRAAALLASGREPVLHIALEVGFESGQSLAKAMRRAWGVAPTASAVGRRILTSCMQPLGSPIAARDPRAKLNRRSPW